MNTKIVAKWTVASAVAAAVLYFSMPHILPAADSAKARSTQQILTELQNTQDQLNGVLKPLPEMDDKTRAEVAVQAVPLLKKDIALVEELAGTEMTAEAAHAKIQFLLIGTFLGDAEMTRQLTAFTQNSDAATALEAKLSLATANWWKNHADAAAQGKILDDLQAMAKATPTEDALADTLFTLEKKGAASAEVAKRAHAIILNDLKGPLAQRIQSAPVLGEPLNFSGPTVDGKTFSSGDYRGKVLLVDFWATWCGPCVAALPEVKKLYQDYHDKGLEIVGVSSDFDSAKLKAFVAKNEMPWPQMWDESKQKSEEVQWHPLALKYGIADTGIPRVLLIDRNGNLQYIDSGEGLPEKVKALVENKSSAAK